MNLLKKGFSLAEMLITLAIIGVVATITMPALQVNTQKAQVIPALKKAVNTLESAHKQIMQEYEVRTLASVTGNANLYRNRLKDVMIGANKVAKSYKVKVNNEDKTFNANTSVQGKDSITFFSSVQRTLTFNQDEDANEVTFKCEYVYVDINGAKGPNRVGADVFLFLVDLRNGNVIPYGSRSFKIDGKSWQTECANNTEPEDAEFCAASIIENGWEILYKY